MDSHSTENLVNADLKELSSYTEGTILTEQVSAQKSMPMILEPYWNLILWSHSKELNEQCDMEETFEVNIFPN